MRRAAITLLVVLGCALAACGDDDSPTAAEPHGHSDESEAPACLSTASLPPDTQKIDAGLTDFEIDLSSSSVKSGKLVIDAKNTGTHAHEIVVVKGVAPEALPHTNNGTGVVDEEQLPPDALLGEIEAFAPDGTCAGEFELTAGTYTLFCNLTGEEGSHSILGMYTTLTVS